MTEDKEDAIKEMIYMLDKHIHFEEDDISPTVITELLEECNSYRKVLEEIRSDSSDQNISDLADTVLLRYK